MTDVATDPPRLPRLHASTRSLLIVVTVGMALTITTRVLAGMGVIPADAVRTGPLILVLLLVPMQNRLAVRAQAGRIDRAFFRTLHRWDAAGITATLLTVLAVVFAVVPPAL